MGRKKFVLGIKLLGCPSGLRVQLPAGKALSVLRGQVAVGREFLTLRKDV